jgi:signal transduction histidine kinase
MESDRQQLISEIELLRQEVNRLNSENLELDLALLAVSEQKDLIEANFNKLSRNLKSEIKEREFAQSKLKSVLGISWQDRDETGLNPSTTERSDQFDYEFYQQVVESVEQIQEQLMLSELTTENRTTDLKQVKAELNALFSIITDVIVVYDRQGNFLKVAPTRVQLHQNPLGEHIVTAHKTLAIQLRDRQIDCIQTVLTSQQAQNLEYGLVINQQEVWFSANVSALTNETVMWVARDISDRQQDELALHQAKAEAELASRKRGEFISSISHEFRTPLNAILGFVQLMNYDSSLNEDHQESLTVIRQSGEHLLGLINDFLEMSKLESGRVSINHQDFDLHSLMQSMIETMTLKTTAKGLNLTLELNADVPQSICTDEGKLRQILTYLLNHAIKFTHSGTITIRLGLVNRQDLSEADQIKGYPLRDSFYLFGQDRTQGSNVIENKESPVLSSPLLLFEIQDTGEGIADEEIQNLFEPFSQSTSEQKIKEGTGLGLAISRKLVRMLGGDITYASIVNVGTTFIFCIEGITQSYFESDLSSGNSKKERSHLSLKQSDLLVMPTPWIKDLSQTSIRADADRILQLIEAVPLKHKFLANMLLKLINEFRFDIIFEVAAQACENNAMEN